MLEVFGKIEWTIEDIIFALEQAGMECTMKNINAIYNECKKDAFGDQMVETGWAYISNAIRKLKEEENREQNQRPAFSTGRIA